MALMTRKSLITVSMLGGGALALAGGFIWSGLYNIGADDIHTRPVNALLETLRERSIEVRAKQLQPPDLTDPARILQGAGNYNAMCTGCHLTPGMPGTELSKGLYPSPPNLTKTTVDGAEAFWVIKHGIKASGMPAWGKSMDDEFIWNMAAFVQTLPGLTVDQYQDLVARSGGHSHGGGESMPHKDGMPGMEGEGHGGNAEAPHDDSGSAPHNHDAPLAPHDDTGSAPHDHAPAAPVPTTHVHADGKTHVHGGTATPLPEPAEAETHDHHDKQ